jgi:hypothetical protein
MADHQIVCTELKYPTQHRHIVAVGVGTLAHKADARWTVDQVRSALARGDRFHTVSPSTGRVAYVEAYNCPCGYRTIKSRADSVTDNNLDNLRACNWS